MLSLQNARIVLNQIGLNDEEIENYEKLVQPHLNFHKYLMDKLDITSEEVEKLTEEFSKKYITNIVKGDETQEELFVLAGQAMKNLAIEQKYNDDLSNELESNIIQLMNMFKEITKKLIENGTK